MREKITSVVILNDTDQIEISKNKYDVEALRNLISKMLDTQEESENNNNLNNTEICLLN